MDIETIAAAYDDLKQRLRDLEGMALGHHNRLEVLEDDLEKLHQEVRGQ